MSDDKPVDFALILLEIAQQDLRASKWLYKKKLYPHAVFFLQQCYEKTFKSLGVFIGPFTPKQLKEEIRHNPLKILAKIMFDFAASLENQAAFPLKEEIAFDSVQIERFEKEIREAANFYRAGWEISKVEKMKVISFLNDLTIPKMRRAILSEVSKYGEEKFETIMPILARRSGLEGITDANEVFMKLISFIIYENLEAMLSLIMLGLLLPQACIEDTRYPTNGLTPSKKYSLRNPIVKHMPKLLESCKNSINQLHLFYAKMIDPAV